MVILLASLPVPAETPKDVQNLEGASRQRLEQIYQQSLGASGAITNGQPAGGGLGGFYPNPTVTGGGLSKSWGTGRAYTLAQNDQLTFVQGTVENAKTLTIQSVNITTTNWTAPVTSRIQIYDATAASTLVDVQTNWVGSVTIAAGHNWKALIINPSNTTEVVTSSIHGKTTP